MRQRDAEIYDVLWKVPAKGEMRLALYVEMPPDCQEVSERRAMLAGDAYTQRWSVRRAGGLSGGTIRVAGLQATMTDVLVRLERLDGTTQVARLTPAAPSMVVETAADGLRVAAIYLGLGIEHILLGIDHLLYILAMLLMVKGWGRVVATMTAFTAAHSLTLTAAALGWVHVPQRPVEACIALSILFVAGEIVRARQGRSGLTERWPWVVSFTFGLLHGFGFAGALSEVGLPPAAIPVALLFFNLGVEFGQLVFITGVLGVWMVARHVSIRRMQWMPGWAWRVPPYAIGSMAMFWLMQRIAAF
jgi:hypothetical protein